MPDDEITPAMANDSPPSAAVILSVLHAMAAALPPKPAALSGMTRATGDVLHRDALGCEFTVYWLWSHRQPDGWRVAYEVRFLGGQGIEGEDATTVAEEAHAWMIGRMHD